MLKFLSNRKIAIALLIGVVLLLFSNSLSKEFAWDDKIILQKAIFTDWNNIGAILTTADTAAPVDNTSYYRPLTYVTFLLDYHLWKLDPFWYTLENVLLHAIVTLLFYLLIAGAFGDNTLALFSSLLFAVHPAVTEPVNFISGGRNTMLCTALSLGSLLLLLHSGSGRRRRVIFSLILFFLALLSKEQAITLPLFLLAVTVLLTSGEFRANASSLAGIFTVTAIYLFLRSHILGSVASQFDITMSYEKAGMVLLSLFEYFRIMLYPLNLNIEYMTEPLPLLSLKSAAAVGGMAALIYIAIRRNMPVPLRISAIWLVLGFLPISNIIPIPSAPLADRYIYFPMLGICLAVGYAVNYLYQKKQVPVLSVFLICIMMLGTLTHARNNVWENEESLWTDVVMKSPEKAVGYYNLGVIYKDKGDKERAIQQNLLTLERDPDYFLAHINLGILYHSQGQIDRAIGKFKDAIKAKPDFATSYYNLALAYHSRGHLDKAIEQYKKAIALKADYAEAYNNMGSAFTSKGNIDEAIKHYESAIQFNPESANAHNNLGSAYRSRGMLDEAITEYKITLKLNPNHIKAIANLRFANTMKAYSLQQKKILEQQSTPKR